MVRQVGAAVSCVQNPKPGSALAEPLQAPLGFAAAIADICWLRCVMPFVHWSARSSNRFLPFASLRYSFGFSSRVSRPCWHDCEA